MFKRSTPPDPARLLALSQQLISSQGAANAHSMADQWIQWHRALSPEQRLSFHQSLVRELSPDPNRVWAAALRYRDAPNAANAIALNEVVESPRQELFRRINRAPNGTEALVQLRQGLLKNLREDAELRALDSDLHHLLSSWFNPGFLELHEITWSSPASLLEKLIRYESVHAIDGWDDLRRRLQPDRRCFAFFHPQLPGEPLIFVEVALLPEIPAHVGPLVDKHLPLGEVSKPKAAIFYSISNCQPGLRGVSLGNFLIKRVAERLGRELPSLKTYCTLSPIPGFTRWLDQGAPWPESSKGSPASWRRCLAAKASLRVGDQAWSGRLKSPEALSRLDEATQEALTRLAACYLSVCTHESVGDPVAKFHLSNGAMLHRINWAADTSAKGLAQSAGLMVNYLYELDEVEARHQAFVNREVVSSRAVSKLL